MGSVYLFSESRNGKGLLAGLPWTPGDKFGLRFTLLPTPSTLPNMRVSGAVINGVYARSALLGRDQSAADSVTAGRGAAIELIGFHLYFATPTDVIWPENGTVVQVLVQPMPSATKLKPREKPTSLSDAPPVKRSP